MIAQATKPGYTIQEKEGRYKVFDKDKKFRQSFDSMTLARAFIAAQECAAHARNKRTVAQMAAGVGLALALLVQPSPVGATQWACGPWKWIQHVHHTAGGSHVDWSRTRSCWIVRGER